MQSNELFNQALQIVQSNDRSLDAYTKLNELHAAATKQGEDEQASRIGDLLEAFIVDGGQMP